MKNWGYKNYSIRQFSALNSTNQKAYELADARQIFDREIILADAQNMGRGREGRVWSSPVGNLYFSLVLQPQALSANVVQLSFVAIVALREAIVGLAAEYNQKINIENKWPNDLLLDGKKVAGLLLESKISQNNCHFVLLGIGVNIDSNPNNTIFPAANLLQFEIKISPEILLQKFLDQFEIFYKNWLDFGFANIRNAWLSKAYCLHKKIEVKINDEKTSGIFLDLDEDGALILKGENGARKISAADIYQN